MGTVVVTRTEANRSAVLDWAVAWAAHPGEKVSGDIHVVRPFEGGALVAVLDGVGHGPEAARAARRAAQVLERHAGESVIMLARRCHEALVGTRGAVASLAAFNTAEHTMSWLGIGNVTGVVLRGDGQSSQHVAEVLHRGGVVGLELPWLQAALITVARGDLLLLATDGIRPEFVEAVNPAQAPQRLVDDLLARYRSPTDDALVLAARYTGEPEERP